jgi:hypothetical protein
MIAIGNATLCSSTGVIATKKVASSGGKPENALIIDCSIFYFIIT